MTENKIAVVFPGQGCQFVGMGSDLYEGYPEARAVFDLADELLGFPLTELCFTGPEEVLGDTCNTQPAIYVASLALWRVLEPRLDAVRSRIAFMAGNSLGEYSALAAAGAFDYEEGLLLVRRRGEAMRDAGLSSPGGMAAIIGLEDAVVEQIVAESHTPEAGVWMANYNSPGQVVIAGSPEGLEKAIALAKERKARRAMPLSVSVACHTPLMAGASDELTINLERTAFRSPWVPIVPNAVAAPASEPVDIKAALLRQLSSPVRWVESVQSMMAGGVTTVLEVGPRAILSGLVRRIDRSLATLAVTDCASLEALDVGSL